MPWYCNNSSFTRVKPLTQALTGGVILLEPKQEIPNQVEAEGSNFKQITLTSPSMSVCHSLHKYRLKSVPLFAWIPFQRLYICPVICDNIKPHTISLGNTRYVDNAFPWNWKGLKSKLYWAYRRWPVNR